MMTIQLIDVGKPCQSSADNLAGLQAHLAILIGEPFRLVRISYGDELTLHLGLRPSKVAKLQGLLYGSHILVSRLGIGAEIPAFLLPWSMEVY